MFTLLFLGTANKKLNRDSDSMARLGSMNSTAYSYLSFNVTTTSSDIVFFLYEGILIHQMVNDMPIHNNANM